jgi:sulfur carrier protein
MFDMTTQHIQVWINQISTVLDSPACLSDAIAAANIKPPFAAAVNMQFVPKNDVTRSLQISIKVYYGGGGGILDQNGISWNHKSGSTASMRSLVFQQVF